MAAGGAAGDVAGRADQTDELEELKAHVQRIEKRQRTLMRALAFSAGMLSKEMRDLLAG